MIIFGVKELRQRYVMCVPFKWDVEYVLNAKKMKRVERKISSPKSLIELGYHVKDCSSILSKTLKPTQLGYVCEKAVRAFPSKPRNQ